MMGAILSAFGGWIWSMLTGAMSWGQAQLWAVWQWVYQGLVDFAAMLLSYVQSVLPQSFVDFMSQTPWTGWSAMLDTVDWFVPIYFALNTYVVVFILSATVRAIRYVVGFIPTVEG